MKVGPLPDPSVGQVPAGAKKTGQEADAAQVAKSTAVAPPTAGATVSVSTIARSEKVDRAQADSFDAAKVEKYKKEIDDGTYVVDHEAIADKMLSNAEEMMPKRK